MRLCNLGKVKFETMLVSGCPPFPYTGAALSPSQELPVACICIWLLAGLWELVISTFFLSPSPSLGKYWVQ